ncbi:MAG: DNA primase [Tissierellia bacterium]|nr:DNA primase [Tissierellia bacterium]
MTLYINDETIEKVREASDIVDVISEYVPLKRSGSNFVGLCPFHHEKTPSFTVSHTKDFFHCFGCGEGGDVIAFIMKRENLSFPEAVKFLADRAGITIEERKPKDNKYLEERNKGYEINKVAARFFYNNLIKNKTALEYLYKRKINNKVIRQFGLGYALDNWNALYNYLKSQGFKDEEILKVGLIRKRSNNDGYYDVFRNRIIFPIIDIRGRVIGFGGRVLDDSMPKYLNSQETYIFSKGNNLFGLNLVNKLSDRKKIIVVEGYMDVISLFNHGINYAVASLGTALTEQQGKLLKRYGQNIYICYDTDNAGIKATLKAIEILRKLDIEPKIVILDGYKDPDDFLKENSTEDFERKLNTAYNHVDYKVFIYKNKFNINQTEGKIGFTKEIAKVIRGLKSPIEKDVYIDKISKEMNISREAIEKEVFGNNNKVVTNKKPIERKNISPVKVSLPTANIRAEVDLLRLMVFNKEYYDKIMQELSLDYYENLECREILKIISDLYIEDEILNEDMLYERVKGMPNLNMTLVDEIIKKPINFLPETVDQMIKDLVTTLKTNRLENERNRIKKKIEEMEKNQNRSPLQEKEFIQLCMELTNLNKELNLIRHEEGR